MQSLSRMKQKYIQLTVKNKVKKRPRLIRKVTKKWSKESRFLKKMKKARLRMKVTRKYMRKSSFTRQKQILKKRR